MGATSSARLRPYTGGGAGPRDSASRNYNAPFTAPVLRGSSSERPPRRCLRALRLGSLYPNKRTAIPQGIALFALSSSGRSLRGQKQRQLRPSAAGGCGPRDPLGRKSNTSFTAQSCRVRPVAHPPKRQSRWATRPAVRRTALLALGPNSSPKLGPARRENRNRFSRPKNSTAQSTTQFSAPCLPHCGSACAPPRLPSPAAYLAGLAECQPAEYALLGERATNFTHRLTARLGKSCQNTQASFDDFPL